MKQKKIILLAIIFCMLFGCFACTDKGGAEPEPELTPAELSEKAMENFVRKLEAGNYEIIGSSKAETHAVSPEQVYIKYNMGEGTHLYYVFMTLKGETFTSMIYDDEKITDVEFLSTDNAIDYLGEMLPNNWISLTQGNMWEIFYNDVNKPLEFTSNDANVKKTMAALGGYGEFALARMQEVHMILDAKDPTSVHFTAEIPDNPVTRMEFDDLDLTLNFGTAKSDSRVDEWMKSPIYPPVRTSWTRDDIAMIENVFLRDYGEEALPFPKTSSYAMIFDDKAYGEMRGIRLIDPHWTEKDIEDYKELLRSKGFTEEDGTLADGTPAKVWRHLLREEHHAYSQLYLNYDNGLELEGTLYHKNPQYEGLAAISEVVRKNGFAALPETDVFAEWKAADTAASQTEGWAYFFDYNFYMMFDLKFSDLEAAKAYLANYRNILLSQGFVLKYTPGEGNDGCATTNDVISFTYRFNEEEDGIVRLEFKNEKSIAPEKIIADLKEHGIPEADIHGDISARDHTRYYYELIDFRGLFLRVYQPFDSVDQAERYLDKYIPVLEERGYYQFDPQKVGSQRSFCWFNEETAKYVAFDIYGDSDDGTIFFEFVSIEPESDSIMLNAIRRR
ncbi:MAG: hypothetical protein IIY33_08010 [Erysipelotrichaceae bacterium]|nr:hypothetical protein [Erysipelotrichaceae bacterium]